jgi:hypothetical protein
LKELIYIGCGLAEHFIEKQEQHHTVTKADHNEALLWKIAVLKNGKAPVSAGTFCPSGMLVFFFPPCQGRGTNCSGTMPRNEIFQRRAYYFIFCSPMQGKHGPGV